MIFQPAEEVNQGAIKMIATGLLDDVGLDFIIIGHYTRNDRSRRVIEKCGFRYVRTISRDASNARAEDSMEYILEAGS